MVGVEHGPVGGRQARADLEGHAVGQGQDAVVIEGHALGVAAEDAQADDPIADGEARDPIADRRDDAGDLAARGEGRLGLKLILAGDDQRVGEVDPAGFDLDEHLLGAGLGLVDVLVGQDLGSTELLGDQCLHGHDRSVAHTGQQQRLQPSESPPGSQRRRSSPALSASRSSSREVQRRSGSLASPRVSARRSHRGELRPSATSGA